MKMLKMVFTLSVIFLGLMLFACSDDCCCDAVQPGVPEQETSSEIEKQFLGGWPELGMNGVTFLKGGIVAYGSKTGHWQYDEGSKILTTDITDDKGNALAWQVNMLQEGSMAGLQLWNNMTFAAKRDVKQAFKDILTCWSWTRDPKGQLLVIDFGIKYDYERNLEDIEYTYSKYKKTFHLMGYNCEKLSLEETDLPAIVVKWYDSSTEKPDQFTIHHPYDFKDVSIEFPKGLKYYPITEGMTEMEKANMSKPEALLVGKWICQEQAFYNSKGNLLYTHVYLEDEYGLEATSDYWCQTWAGSDELLEIGREGFTSWWIDNDRLRTNEFFGSGEDWYIISLEEKEMTLQMRYRDGEYTTAKFYRYDESEGLLGDRLEYVDLGLSVKWATRNLGAEDKDASLTGNYYAWGETMHKSDFKPENYKFYKQEDNIWKYYKLTKYCTDAHYGYEFFQDNKMILDDEDDAARAVRGGDWRMPTPEEVKELVEKCSWTWTSDYKGYEGYLVTGKTGYFIFLPAAGCHNMWGLRDEDEGFYLTNSLVNKQGIVGADFPMMGVFHFTNSARPSLNNLFYDQFRHFGCSIRPVHP